MKALSIADWLNGERRPPCVDLRSEEEFRAGHLPDAANLPAPQLSERVHELPPRGGELFVVGDASGEGAAFLEKRGAWQILASEEDLSALPDSILSDSEPAQLWRPNPWLASHFDAILPGGRCLDLAMGTGRNAVWLAQRGFAAEGEEILPEAVARAKDLAARCGVSIEARVGDVTRPGALPAGRYDAIVVVSFLERDLFPALATALAPGGVLIYETFTREQAERVGRPSNPRWLLEPGELREAFEDTLKVLAYREGRPEERRCVASLIARRC